MALPQWLPLMQQPLPAPCFTLPFELVYYTARHHLWSWKRKHTEVWLKERSGGEMGTLLTFSWRDSWTLNSMELCNPLELHRQHLAFCKQHFAVQSWFTFFSFSVIHSFFPPKDTCTYKKVPPLFTLNTRYSRHSCVVYEFLPCMEAQTGHVCHFSTLQKGTKAPVIYRGIIYKYKWKLQQRFHYMQYIFLISYYITVTLLFKPFSDKEYVWLWQKSTSLIKMIYYTKGVHYVTVCFGSRYDRTFTEWMHYWWKIYLVIKTIIVHHVNPNTFLST